MERRILTTAAVRALKAGPQRREVRDHGAVGLYLTIQASGFKSWCLRFRGKDGAPTKLVLGPLDLTGQEFSGDITIGMPLSLGAARQLANTLHRQRAFGDDIIGAHKKQKQQSDDTFGRLVEDYLEEHASKTRSLKRTTRVLEGVCEAWGNRPVVDVTSQDVFELVQSYRTRPLPGLEARTDTSTARQRRLRAVLGGLFSWAYKHRRVAANPAGGLPGVSAGPSRDRVLDRREIAAVWNSCDGPFGSVVQMLILTGGRLREIAEMRWDEIVDGVFTLPAARSKNNRPLVTPLPELALRIIDAQPKIGPYVFSVSGHKPLTGFSKAKARLDQRSGVTDWRLHDCRRVFVTGCNELGVRSEVVEKLVNHTSGRSVVAGVYDRSSLMAERRRALAMWASHIEDLVAGREAVIVPLRA